MKDKRKVILEEPKIKKKKWDDVDQSISVNSELSSDENYEAYSFGGGYSLDE